MFQANCLEQMEDHLLTGQNLTSLLKRNETPVEKVCESVFYVE